MRTQERTRGNRVSYRSLLGLVVALLFLCAIIPQPVISPPSPVSPPANSSPPAPLRGQRYLQKASPGPPHDPITILSDADFQGWPGSGMPGDPYRIENYSIAVVTIGQSCIEIADTSVHFVVTQCSLSASDVLANTSGITLKNVQNGRVDNNTFLYGLQGIYVQNSSFTTVVNSIFSRQRSAAVAVEWSNSCILANNTLLDSVNGIGLHRSELCQLAGNNCTSSRYAIALEESDSNMVFNNTCAGATSAIRIESSSENNTVANNTSIECYLGIGISWSDSNRIVQNHCINSTGGIGLEGSDHCWIINNTLVNLAGGGIEVSASDNCTVLSNTLTLTQAGIYLRWSGSSTIANNSIIRSVYGISFYESNASIADNNTLLGCGFSVSGDTVPGCRQVRLNYNLVNGQPLVFWQDHIGGIVPADAGQVILVNCTSIVVQNQVLANCTIGIQLSFCNGSSITNNECTDNQDGISLRLCWFNNLSANTLERNHHGLFLDKSSNNTMTKQICTKNDIGIRLAWWSSNNTLTDNTCTESWQGITLEHQSGQNRILRNVLSGNVYNAYDTAPGNIFDYNYWSDYWGFDLNQDGIGDIPYLVPPTVTGSFDPHPLMSLPGTPPTFGPREAFWLAIFLTPVVGVAMLVGFVGWFYRRRKMSNATRGRRPRTHRQSKG